MPNNTPPRRVPDHVYLSEWLKNSDKLPNLRGGNAVDKSKGPNKNKGIGAPSSTSPIVARTNNPELVLVRKSETDDEEFISRNLRAAFRRSGLMFSFTAVHTEPETAEEHDANLAVIREHLDNLRTKIEEAQTPTGKEALIRDFDRYAQQYFVYCDAFSLEVEPRYEFYVPM